MVRHESYMQPMVIPESQAAQPAAYVFLRRNVVITHGPRDPRDHHHVYVLRGYVRNPHDFSNRSRGKETYGPFYAAESLFFHGRHDTTIDYQRSRRIMTLKWNTVQA